MSDSSNEPLVGEFDLLSIAKLHAGNQSLSGTHDKSVIGTNAEPFSGSAAPTSPADTPGAPSDFSAMLSALPNCCGISSPFAGEAPPERASPAFKTSPHPALNSALTATYSLSATDVFADRTYSNPDDIIALHASPSTADQLPLIATVGGSALNHQWTSVESQDRTQVQTVSEAAANRRVRSSQSKSEPGGHQALSLAKPYTTANSSLIDRSPKTVDVSHPILQYQQPIPPGELALSNIVGFEAKLDEAQLANGLSRPHSSGGRGGKGNLGGASPKQVSPTAPPSLPIPIFTLPPAPPATSWTAPLPPPAVTLFATTTPISVTNTPQPIMSALGSAAVTNGVTRTPLGGVPSSDDAALMKEHFQDSQAALIQTPRAVSVSGITSPSETRFAGLRETDVSSDVTRATRFTDANEAPSQTDYPMRAATATQELRASLLRDNLFGTDRGSLSTNRPEPCTTALSHTEHTSGDLTAHTSPHVLFDGTHNPPAGIAHFDSNTHHH